MASSGVPGMGNLEETTKKRQFALLVTGLRHHFQANCAVRLKEVGLTQGLMYFVLYVGTHEGCTQTEMNNALCVDVGYSTRSVAKLVEAGLMDRRPNPTDRRSNLLYLTDGGAEAFSFVVSLMEEWNAAALSCLDEREKGQLVDLLGRVAASLGAQSEYGD